VFEGDRRVTHGKLSIRMTEAVGTTAYQLIITPQQGTLPLPVPDHYEAQYAGLSGSARVSYGTPDSPRGSFVEGYAGSSSASTCFIVTAQEDRFYDIQLHYCALQIRGEPAAVPVRVTLNGAKLKDIDLPLTDVWDAWSESILCVFLQAGINRIAFDAPGAENDVEIWIAGIDVAPGSGPALAYEAEAKENTLAGTALVQSHPAASGGKCVTNIGGGAGSYLQFNDITAPEDGTYIMVVSFANAEFRGGHAYNSQVVDRCAEISVNGSAAQKVYFRNTFAWDHYQTRVVEVDLRAGQNTIRFCNSGADSYAPNIDRIVLFCEK
jgi:hypothetical protein